MKKSKHQQYFHCFIVCVLVPYAFWFSYQQNTVTILISPAFRNVALIRGRRLFEASALIRGNTVGIWVFMHPVLNFKQNVPDVIWEVLGKQGPCIQEMPIRQKSRKSSLQCLRRYLLMLAANVTLIECYNFNRYHA